MDPTFHRLKPYQDGENWSAVPEASIIPEAGTRHANSLSMNQAMAGANGVLVITQVIPPTQQQQIQVGTSVFQNVLCQFPVPLQRFIKGEPKALGKTAFCCIGSGTMMLVLESSGDRKKLEERLAQSVPESMKVYGSVFYINRGNPLNMEVLVDSWPEFKTVICKKKAMEMLDDTDIYTNTYNVFTKDSKNFREMLWTTDVINWNQCLLIQGVQQCLNDVIMSIAESKGLEVKSEAAALFVRKIHAGVCEKSPNTNFEEESSTQTKSPLKASMDDQPVFFSSPLSGAEAELVNTNWINGGNENSLKMVRQCIQHLPNLCMRDAGGKPISWFAMDQTAAMRMGYTVPEYRGKGIFTSLFISFIVFLHLQWDDFPYHFTTSKQNVQVHSVARRVGLRKAPCDCFKYICRPQVMAT